MLLTASRDTYMISEGLEISETSGRQHMDESLEQARDSVIDGLGKLTDFFGFSPVMGHLYGALLMSPGALSLDELEESAGKSKASVSMNMRALERWGMVREVWVKGDRRKFYEAEGDFWKIVTSILGSRERREVRTAVDVLERNARRLEAAQAELSEADQELSKHYLKRIGSMLEFFRFAQLGLDFLLARSQLPSAEDLAPLNNDRH